MKFLVKLILGFSIGLGFSLIGNASENLDSAIKLEMAKRYPGARIEILSAVAIPDIQNAKRIGVAIIDEDGRGDANIEVRFPVADGSVRSWNGSISFAAWMKTFVAVRRIHPGETLSDDAFRLQDVNVATGMAREYRGVMLPPETKISSLQARNTVLEGQYPLTSGVEKIPDIRRGDSVRVVLTSGEIQLTSPAIAQEPGYLNGQIRVLTLKSKRELIGQLRENGVVEVTL